MMIYTTETLGLIKISIIIETSTLRIDEVSTPIAPIPAPSIKRRSLAKTEVRFPTLLSEK